MNHVGVANITIKVKGGAVKLEFEVANSMQIAIKK